MFAENQRRGSITENVPSYLFSSQPFVYVLRLLELVCEEPREYSNTVTAVFVPEGYNADELRAKILANFDMSLGAGLSKLAGKVFRIGHLGHFNDLMLAGTLSGVEMGLRLAGIPHRKGGVMAALDALAPNLAQASLGEAKQRGANL